jgi:hypothetical protein
MSLFSWLRGRNRVREPKTVWLRGTDSPFGIDVLDCREVTQGMISATDDPDVAETFLRLRREDGNAYRGRDPDDAAEADGNLEYRLEDPPPDGPLVKAATMEDKWDIYLHRPNLYFVLSWTGQIAYRARVSLGGDMVRIERIAHPADEPPQFARGMVDFLIKSHLYGQLLPHPVPEAMPVEDVAMYSFAVFGRRCGFASYEDTTVVPLVFRNDEPRTGGGE